jgi:hypothetical protein
MYGCWCRTGRGILCFSRIVCTSGTSETYIFFKGVLYKIRLINTGVEYVLYSLENWVVNGNGSYLIPTIYCCNLFHIEPDTVRRTISRLVLIRESTCRSTGYHVRNNINDITVLL